MARRNGAHTWQHAVSRLIATIDHHHHWVSYDDAHKMPVGPSAAAKCGGRVQARGTSWRAWDQLGSSARAARRRAGTMKSGARARQVGRTMRARARALLIQTGNGSSTIIAGLRRPEDIRYRQPLIYRWRSSPFSFARRRTRPPPHQQQQGGNRRTSGAYLLPARCSATRMWTHTIICGGSTTINGQGAYAR